jgi:N-acetylneuraminic acid mutarotase
MRIVMGKNAALLLLLIFLAASCVIVVKPAFPSKDAAENTWVTKAPMQVPRDSLGVAVVNGKIYAIGGYGGTSTNEEYDPVTNTWSTKTPMPTPRSTFAIATYQNIIYCIGGLLTNNTKTGINEAYDPATDTWQTEASMPTNRFEMNAETVNGKIYVMGGRTADAYSTVNITEIYDPASNSWTRGAAMPYPVVLYASAVVDNKIYVIGGQDEYVPAGDVNVAFNQIYDPATDTWSQGTPIPAPMGQRAVADDAAAGATTGGAAPKRIYVIGGSVGFAVGSNQNYAYNPKTNTWTSAAPMPTARYSAAVAVVNDLLYVIGGSQAASVLATNERYTPFGYVTIAPKVSIVSPENRIYNSSSVPLIFTVDKPTVQTDYSLDGRDNVTIMGNLTLNDLTNGAHNITVYALDNYGIRGASETAIFTIEQPAPFPTALAATAFGVSATVIGIGLLVYFKKRKH